MNPLVHFSNAFAPHLLFLVLTAINVEEVKQLARQIKLSDAAAFKTVFELYQEGIFNFAHYKLGNVDAAEDIVQEVFIKLWENRHHLKEDRSLKSYLFTIANNLAMNYLRHSNVVMKFQQELGRSSSMQESPQGVFERKEFHEKLLACIAGLPEKTRIVFMMSRMEQLSYREIAERLDISIKTVESHIGNALKTLRKSLQTAAL
jgi:RNA polymerase sigma-70 factor (ECF subfamily)